MNIRYFIVKDRIKKREMPIKYCNTKDMTADFFSKPVQGRQFYKFRKAIMNIDEDDVDYALKPIDYPITKESIA